MKNISLKYFECRLYSEFRSLDRQVANHEQGAIYLRRAIKKKHKTLVEKYIDEKKASSFIYLFLGGKDRKKMKILNAKISELKKGVSKIEESEIRKRPEVKDACTMIGIEAKPEYTLRCNGIDTSIMEIVDTSVDAARYFEKLIGKKMGIQKQEEHKKAPYVVAVIDDYDMRISEYRKSL